MSSQRRAVGSFFMVGWGLSNNVGRHAWPMLKKLKLKTLIKTPQSSPPKKEIWTKI